MATRDELLKALRAADAAGNESDARRLAASLSNYTEANNAPAPAPDGNELYAKMPIWQKALAHPADSLRIANDAVTLGGWDKLWGNIAPMIGGGDVEQQRKWTQDAYDRGGSGAQALGITAGVIPALATDGATAAPALGTGIRGMLAKGAVAAGEGAGYGGIQAINKDQDVGSGMKSGAAFGVAGQVIGSTLGRVANKVDDMLHPPAKPMSLDNLRAAKDQAYADTAAAGVQYTPNTIRGMLASMDAAAQPYPGRHDGVIATRRQIGSQTNLDEGRRPVTLPEVDRNRQIIQMDTNLPNDPSSSGMGYDYIHAMDDYLGRVDQSGVTARSGDPVAGLELQNKARELNTRTEKLKDMEALDYKSSLQAAKNIHSGVDSTLKNNVTGILTNPKRRRGYSPDEIAQMEEVVRGTTGQNILRQVGRMAPGGGFSGIGGIGGAGLGAAVSGLNPVLTTAFATLPSAIGYGAKKLSERSTAKSGQKLLDLVASGGVKAPPRTKAVSAQDKDRIGRALMMLMMNQSGQAQ